MTEFTIKIQLTSPDMLSGIDIAGALHKVSNKLVGFGPDPLADHEKPLDIQGEVLDRKGKVVGKWGATPV